MKNKEKPASNEKSEKIEKPKIVKKKNKEKYYNWSCVCKCNF